MPLTVKLSSPELQLWVNERVPEPLLSDQFFRDGPDGPRGRVRPPTPSWLADPLEILLEKSGHSHQHRNANRCLKTASRTAEQVRYPVSPGRSSTSVRAPGRVVRRGRSRDSSSNGSRLFTLPCHRHSPLRCARALRRRRRTFRTSNPRHGRSLSCRHAPSRPPSRFQTTGGCGIFPYSQGDTLLPRLKEALLLDRQTGGRGARSEPTGDDHCEIQPANILMSELFLKCAVPGQI
jgi:hypothetical protein